jgi:predicted  nucleic acid-binding Zn-ribbon protein
MSGEIKVRIKTKIKGKARQRQNLPAKEESWTADTLQKFLSIYQDLLVFAEW